MFLNFGSFQSEEIQLLGQFQFEFGCKLDLVQSRNKTIECYFSHSGWAIWDKIASHLYILLLYMILLIKRKLYIKIKSLNQLNFNKSKNKKFNYYILSY